MRAMVLDTNVLIGAIRNDAARARLAEWQRAMAPFIHQHAVVVAELLAGARDDLTWRRWHEQWIQPAERIGRVITPGYATWLRASRIIARLTAARSLSPDGVGRGFLDDCLLAASALENGFTIITHNKRDFALIATVEPQLDHVAPLPGFA